MNRAKKNKFSESDCKSKDVSHLDLGKEVDPDPFGLQAARLLDPHPKVLHVCVNHILHCSAESKSRECF